MDKKHWNKMILAVIDYLNVSNAKFLVGGKKKKKKT